MGHLVDIVTSRRIMEVRGNTGSLIGSRNDQSILGGTSLGLGFLVLRGCCGSGSFCLSAGASLEPQPVNRAAAAERTITGTNPRISFFVILSHLIIIFA